MKHLRIAFTLLLSLTLLGAAQADSGRYIDSDNGFSLSTPSAWTVSSEDAELSVTSPESTDRYTIKFTVQVMPVGDLPLTRFTEVMKSQVEVQLGKVVEEKSVSLDGVAAQQLVWEVRKNAQISRNITVTAIKDGKLYMLNGRLPKGRFSELQSSIAGMVNSFGFVAQ